MANVIKKIGSLKQETEAKFKASKFEGKKAEATDTLNSVKTGRDELEKEAKSDDEKKELAALDEVIKDAEEVVNSMPADEPSGDKPPTSTNGEEGDDEEEAEPTLPADKVAKMNRDFRKVKTLKQAEKLDKEITEMEDKLNGGAIDIKLSQARQARKKIIQSFEE